jgi:eukaryotic-like serine/threonine-protein kinase
VIVFSPDIQEGIYSVPAAGGQAIPITKLNEAKQDTTHRYPFFLPDGKHFLYVAGSLSSPIKGEANAIYVASLDGKLNKRLINAPSNALYANGFLLFVLDKILMAYPFDASDLKLIGDPFPVAEKILYATAYWRGAFSVSQNRILTYGVGSSADAWPLAWFDRTGKQIGTLADRAAYDVIRLSPDDKFVAAAVTDPETGNDDIWLYDLSKGVRTRFTFSTANDTNPLWSPDGAQIVYTNDGRNGNDDIFIKPANGLGREEPLLQTDGYEVATSWSPDRRFLCYDRRDPKTKGDIWILPVFGDRKPFPFLNSVFHEHSGSFSPDGKWLAYVSDETGRSEVYVTPFPSRAGKWQVSKGALFGAWWSKDGKEIFYGSADVKLTAVPVKTDPTFESGVPVALLDLTIANNGTISSNRQRFLLSLQFTGQQNQPIRIVTNWTADLRR